MRRPPDVTGARSPVTRAATATKVSPPARPTARECPCSHHGRYGDVSAPYPRGCGIPGFASGSVPKCRDSDIRPRYRGEGVDEKHHLVPEFYLRGFADGERVMLTDRALRRSFPTSVNRALKAGRYYELTQSPTVDLRKLDPGERAAYLEALNVMNQMPEFTAQIIERNGDIVRVLPGAVETVLSFFEGKAEGALRRLRESFPHISGDDRLWVATFIGVQFVRGEALRAHVDEAMKLMFAQQMQRSPQMQRDWRRRTGRTLDDVSTAMEGIHFGGDRVFALMFEVFEHTVPIVLAKTWRLLEFEPGSVLTSDEPVGLWARPGRDLTAEPLGMTTADAVYFPVDSSSVLQLLNPESCMPELRRTGAAAKVRHSNQTVASAARRWVVSRPGSTALAGLQVRRLPTVHMDTVASRMAEDGTYRELIRVSARPPREPRS